MATPNKLGALEKQRGDLDKVIPPLVNSHGQAEAAKKLKLSPATISKWLKANNYRPHTTWVKQEE